ncbi:MAG: class I SAM-dependent methyltransferase [Candidatus Binatia bacterium]
MVDGIPRLLPDSLRDTRSDDEFFAANREAFSRLGISQSHFGSRTATLDLYRQFQRQRLLWGVQDRWEDLYQAPVEYSSPKRKRRWKDTKGALRFFSMNLHCEYGTQPRKDQIIAQVGAGGGKLTLDVGCGGAGNRALLETNGNRYVGLDVQAFNGPDVQASAAALPFGDGTFDFIICDSVLEHVPDPWRVTAELFRVLKPGGKGMFVVPFIYKNHGAPFDFFRYTKSGLHTLLRNYAVVKIYSFGGFFHVVGHMMEAFYSHIPFGVGRLMKAIHNCVFFALNKLDRFDRYRIFCRGYYAEVDKAS